MDIISNTSDLFIYVYHCGMQHCSPGHFYGPAVRDHFILHYVMEGKGIFKYNDKVYNLSKGNGFLICPNYVTFYQADQNDPWTYAWIGFVGTNAEHYLKQAKLSMENPVFLYDKDDAVEKYLLEAVSSLEQVKSIEAKLLGLLYLILSKLIEQYDSEYMTEHYSSLQEGYVKEAIKFIKANYFSRKLTVIDISNYLNINNKYFSMIFKKNTGMTPQQYLINFRIEKSCELLKDKILTIGDVSRSVGYDDQLVFSKAFKRVKGVSPSKYRTER